MKAKMEFEFPDDKFEFVVAFRGFEFYQAIKEIERIVRQHEKYEAKLEDCWKEIVETIREIDTEIEG